MDKIRVGVIGANRGMTMIEYCKQAENAELVAVCDNYPPFLDMAREALKGYPVSFYESYDEFLTHDMDAVVLANFATEHAPFAIKALNAGKHVYSEVLPCQTLQEAVQLVEAVENTGKTYVYGENYCYSPATQEMRKRCKAGDLGTIEYGEGEYIHNCASIWPEIAYGDPDHWRNNVFSSYYCTHSLGPLIHISGLRPVQVVGFEPPFFDRCYELGRKRAPYAVEIVTMETGIIFKSIHGDLTKDNTWFCIYGSKGSMESARRITEHGANTRIYANLDEYVGQDDPYIVSYSPHDELTAKARATGHSGSDFYTMYNFIEHLRGNPEADVIGVYEALDMCLPGIFAFRSILNGNKPMEIPNMRDKAVREKYRNDTACTDPKVAGDQLLPTCSTPLPEFTDEVYENQKRRFEEFEAKLGIK